MKPKSTKKAASDARRKWNFIDYLLILLVLISVVSIVMRVLSMEENKHTADSTAVLGFTSGDILTEVAEEALKETGFTLGGSFFADVEELSVTPALLSSHEQTDVLYLPSTQYVRLSGKLRVSGAAAENGFFLGGRTYCVPGVSLSAVGAHAMLSVTVTDIALE